MVKIINLAFDPKSLAKVKIIKLNKKQKEI